MTGIESGQSLARKAERDAGAVANSSSCKRRGNALTPGWGASPGRIKVNGRPSPWSRPDAAAPLASLLHHFAVAKRHRTHDADRPAQHRTAMRPSEQTSKLIWRYYLSRGMRDRHPGWCQVGVVKLPLVPRAAPRLRRRESGVRQGGRPAAGDVRVMATRGQTDIRGLATAGRAVRLDCSAGLKVERGLRISPGCS